MNITHLQGLGELEKDSHVPESWYWYITKNPVQVPLLGGTLLSFSLEINSDHVTIPEHIISEAVFIEKSEQAINSFLSLTEEAKNVITPAIINDYTTTKSLTTDVTDIDLSSPEMIWDHIHPYKVSITFTGDSAEDLCPYIVMWCEPEWGTSGKLSLQLVFKNGGKFTHLSTDGQSVE